MYPYPFFQSACDDWFDYDSSSNGWDYYAGALAPQPAPPPVDYSQQAAYYAQQLAAPFIYSQKLADQARNAARNLGKDVGQGVMKYAPSITNIPSTIPSISNYLPDVAAINQAVASGQLTAQDAQKLIADISLRAEDASKKFDESNKQIKKTAETAQVAIIALGILGGLALVYYIAK